MRLYHFIWFLFALGICSCGSRRQAEQELLSGTDSVAVNTRVAATAGSIGSKTLILRFSNLNSEQGLSPGQVRDILQDHSGFIWFATPSGLNRYDGRKIIKYCHNENDSFSISDNDVFGLYDDGEYLWVGTDRGLNRYDSRTGKFKVFKHSKKAAASISSDAVSVVVRGEHGTMWIGAAGVLEHFDPVSGSFRHFPLPEVAGRTASINDLCCDSHGLVWVVSLSGYFLFDPEKGTFSSFEANPSYSELAKIGQSFCITEDKQSNIWIGGMGLAVYNRSHNSFRYYQHLRDDENSPSEGAVFALFCDKAGSVWIGSTNGLTVYDSTKFSRYLHDPGDVKSLVNNQIFSLYEDREGIVWVGTSDGISKTDPYSTQFRVIQLKPGDKHSLSNNIVHSIIQSADGSIWAATEAGVNKIDIRNGRCKVYAAPVSYGKMTQYISWALHEDRDGNIWIGTWGGGLHRLDPDKDSFQAFLTNMPGGGGSYVISINEDSLHRYWLATWGDGLICFDPRTKAYVAYRPDENKPNSVSNNRIMLSFVDHEGTVWAGGAELDKYRPQTGDFEHIGPDASRGNRIRNVSALIETRGHVFWVGTAGGLCRYDPAHNIIDRFTTADGLPSDAIAGLAEDDDGNIWVSTSAGLAMMDSNQSCQKPASGAKTDGAPACDLFTRYTTKDGLPSNVFVGGKSAFKDRDGSLYFGTVAGLVVFRPRSMVHNSVAPPVYITSIKKQNKELLTRNEVFYTNNLCLDYKDRSVAFEFAALNYSQPEKNQFAYKLEGWDEDWQFSGTRNFASYTNLDPGNYRFHVKAANNDGVWNEQGISFSIRVFPPWWRTWWFGAICIAAASASVIGYNRFRLRQLRKQKKTLEQTVARRTEELRLAKERAERSEQFRQQFLANMSHEIRTPMNAVMGMTNLLMDKQPRDDQQFYLEKIQSSSDVLLHIINDILDLSKIEAGKIELEKIPFSLRELIAQVQQLFLLKAEEKGLALTTQVDASIPDILVGDPVRLTQVLMNLTGNALKFTEKGSVRIAVALKSHEEEQVRLHFSVTDTGIGIPEQKMNAVFESFTQANNSDTRRFGGSGLGLTISKELVALKGGSLQVQSSVDAGSTFSFEVEYAIGNEVDFRDQNSSEQGNGLALNGLRILLVDDNEYNLIVAADTLRARASVTIDTAGTGAEAINLLWQKDYDVILMDVQMPDMDGYEATRYIRASFQPPWNAVPIIALTASVLKVDLDKCLQAGMNDYLLKPFKPHELIGVIARALGRIPANASAEGFKLPNTPSSAISFTDMGFLSQFCEGDTTKMKRYRELFIAASEGPISRIREAITASDPIALKAQVHALKQGMTMMGMTSCLDIVHTIEPLAAEGRETGRVMELAGELLQQLNKAKEELCVSFNGL